MVREGNNTAGNGVGAWQEALGCWRGTPPEASAERAMSTKASLPHSHVFSSLTCPSTNYSLHYPWWLFPSDA